MSDIYFIVSVLIVVIVIVCDDGSDININNDIGLLRDRRGFVIQRHKKHHGLEAEILNTFSDDVQVEPVFQEITKEVHIPVRTELRMQAQETFK